MKAYREEQTPLISVIMGIYNCADTLPEAIECIINQTYGNWELIMCNDASTDATLNVAETYREQYPDKIILLSNDRNMGLNYSLNRCLEKANGQYIARMDGDDLCSSDRFEKELEVFRKEEDISIVSTDMAHFDDDGIWGRFGHPTRPVPADFVHGTPFCHAPCMVKKEAYDTVGGYSVSDRLLRVEDYHLWIKMYAAGFKGYNLHEPLYQMRDDRNAYQRRKMKYRRNEAYVIRIAVNELKLPGWMKIYSILSVLKGLLPEKVYMYLHKRRVQDGK